MNREDQFDQLIEQHLHDSSWHPASGEDAALLAAAEVVELLHDLEVPSALAARVEQRLRAQLRVQQNGHGSSLEQNRSGRLREPVPQPVSRRYRRIYRSAWIAALSAAALLLLFFGVNRVAASSLPGDPLYGLKQIQQQMALSNASDPADRANVQISQLRGALADLDAEVNNGRSDADVTAALQVVASDTQASQAAVDAVPAGVEHDAVAQALANTLQTEHDTLYRLLPNARWPLRLAFTQQLGTLGAQVPEVTQVQVISNSHDTLTLQVTGANFVPGAQVVINGTPKGTITQVTSTTIVAVISESAWPEDMHTVGVLNPDGTAAQVTVSGDDGDHGQQETPSPSGTPGSGDDGGGHDGSGGGGGSGGGDGGSGGSGGSSGGSGSGGGGSGGGGSGGGVDGGSH